MNAALNFTLMMLLLVMPSKGSAAALNALRIWGLELVPSLFPYMVLCQTLTQSLVRTQRTGAFIPFCLGMLGGSPSASASLSMIAQNRPMNRKEKLFLSVLSGTISPMFFLSLTSSWFSSMKTALELLVSQYAGALMAGLLFYRFSANDAPCNSRQCSQSSANRDEDPIIRSVQAVLNVGGCIVFYSTAAACILPLFSSLCAGLPQCLHALLEISGGLHSLSSAQLPGRIKEILAAGVCGFGGLSILNQNLLFLRTIGIEKKDLLLASAARGLFSMLTMFLLSFIL